MRLSAPGLLAAARRWAPLAFVVLALLYFWPMLLHPNWAAFIPRAPFNDLTLTHLPNALYWREALTGYGQWPLWNEQIYAGMPFAADPLAGIWYPPALVLLVLPLPFGFNFLLVLHLAWAGYGLFRFLRSEGLGNWASALGAAGFAGAPKVMAHLGAGHVSLVYAVSWTPWLLLAARRVTHLEGQPTIRQAVGRGAVAGAVMAMVFLADVRWAYYAGLLVLAYTAINSLRPGLVRRVVGLLAFGAFFLLLSAVLALPLVEFARLASRSALTLADGGLFSLPPTYLIGLFIPDLGGYHEWMTYVGAVPLLLAVAGLGRRTFFWAAVALVTIAYSLGTNFVLFPMVYRVLPLASLLRVPPRAWFLMPFAVGVMAGFGLQRLLDNVLPFLARRYAALHIQLPPATAMAVVLLALTVLDLVRVDTTLVDMRPVTVAPATAWLQQQPGLFRVYTPTFSLPYGDGLQHVDGVDPLQLSEALALIEPAIAVHADSYSVVVPAYSPTNSPRGIAANQPSAALLGLLDVKYVASEFELTDPTFKLAASLENVRIYLNGAWGGRAWVEGAEPDAAALTFWSPNRLEARATGPGRLVVGEIAYSGWQAWVDGRPTPIEVVDGALRSVRLGPGEHSVVFEFRPTSVYVGGALSATGLVGLLILAWLQLQRAR